MTAFAPVRWGYLGAGFIAREALVPAAAGAPHAELVAIGARDADRARALVPSGGRAHGDYADLIDDPDVEAVYISLTNDLHRTWALRALAAGKHVLCEKPLGMDAGEVRDMVAAAEDAGLLLVEAAWNRWHPRTQRAIELLRSGRFGSPRTIRSAFTFRGVAADNFRWLPDRGGGALYDLAAYPLAAALWITDWPPIDDTVVASIVSDVRWAASGVDASTRVKVQLRDAVADLHMSIDDDAKQSLVVRTDSGELSLSPPVFNNRNEVSTLAARRDDSSDTVEERFDPVDPYAVMLDAVSRAIRGDSTAWVLPHEESIRTAELLDAVRAASGTPG